MLTDTEEYLIKFSKNIYNIFEKNEAKIDCVVLSLNRIKHGSHSYIKIYVDIKLIDGAYLKSDEDLFYDEKYLSYHIPEDEKHEWKTTHPIHRAESDMYHVFHLLKWVCPNLNISIKKL